MIAIRDKNFVVLGLGKTGKTTLEWLQAEGAGKIYVWDDKVSDFSSSSSVILSQTPPWDEVSALVQSPGIPPSHPLNQSACERGVPVVTDCDLFRQKYPDLRIIGVTGTNGKSTTTALIHHMLNAAGEKAILGGNIGMPVLSLPCEEDTKWAVLELSSYQLELSSALDLEIAVWLNLQPDHLERHKTMEGYAQAKERIFDGLQKACVIGQDDEISQQIAKKYEAKTNVVRISVSQPSDICVEEGWLKERGLLVADLNEMPRLKGVHNHQNMAAAYAVGRIIGIPAAVILKSFKTFEGLAHRQQWVSNIAGIDFINDSKATNADATARALACFDEIYWIVGGRPKSEGIQGLDGHYPKIRQAFLIGEAEDDFAKILSGRVPFERCGTLAQAVQRAFSVAISEGGKGVILLSPACASFDQYRDFEARGEHFCQLVKNLEVQAHAV